MNKWSYETPLDPPPEDVTLNERVIEINGMPFQGRSDCDYETDYYKLFDRIQKSKSFTAAQRKKNPLENEPNLIRNLLRKDLWALVYFVMRNPLANHPFIVEACREVQYEEGDTLQIWARDHLKTTIISTGRQAQKVLCDPECRIGIFSAVRPLAVKIQSVIKKVFEDPFVVRSFPDILYENASKEAEKWSEAPEGGLIVKRQGFYKEPTVSAWGLVDGMPTGFHFSDMIFDDIVTQSTLGKDVQHRIKQNFDMAENLGTRGGTQQTVVGTFYEHDDPLVYISKQRDPDDDTKPLYRLVKKPATEGGELKGKAVFESERSLARKRSKNIRMFYTQQLCDPTPRGAQQLDPGHLIYYTRKTLPKRLRKVMLIDGAGNKGVRNDGRNPDAWAILVVGVEPQFDPIDNDYSMSRSIILDACIKEMSLAEAQAEIVAMYLRNGRIQTIGVEKVAMSTTEIHVRNALRKKRRFLSVKNKGLTILKPSGRSKEYRIESALALPLKNGKLGILDTVPEQYIERISEEMRKFPRWKDDGLDAWSYCYDIVKDLKFSAYEEESEPESPYDRAFRKARESRVGGEGWITV